MHSTKSSSMSVAPWLLVAVIVVSGTGIAALDANLSYEDGPSTIGAPDTWPQWNEQPEILWQEEMPEEEWAGEDAGWYVPLNAPAVAPPMNAPLNAPPMNAPFNAPPMNAPFNAPANAPFNAPMNAEWNAPMNAPTNAEWNAPANVPQNVGPEMQAIYPPTWQYPPLVEKVSQGLSSLGIDDEPEVIPPPRPAAPEPPPPLPRISPPPPAPQPQPARSVMAEAISGVVGFFRSLWPF